MSRMVESTSSLLSELFVLTVNPATGAVEVVAERKESAAAKSRRREAAKAKVRRGILFGH